MHLPIVWQWFLPAETSASLCKRAANGGINSRVAATQLPKIDSYGLPSHIPPPKHGQISRDRRRCQAAKSGKQIERCVIASFRIAESMGL